MRLSKRAIRLAIIVSVVLALLISAFFYLYIIPFRLPQYTAQCLIYAVGEENTDDLIAIASSETMKNTIRQNTGIVDPAFQYEVVKKGNNSFQLICRGYSETLVRQFAEEGLLQLKYSSQEFTGLEDLIEADPILVSGGYRYTEYYISTVGIFVFALLFFLFLFLTIPRASQKVREVRQMEDLLGFPCMGTFVRTRKILQEGFRLDTYSMLPVRIQKQAEEIGALLQASDHTPRFISFAGTGQTKWRHTAFVCAVLSCVLQKLGKKVLLMDGNLSKGTVSDFIQVHQSMGFSAYLNGDANLEEIIVPTPVKGIDLIGYVTGEKPNLFQLQDEQLERFVFEISQKYDAVLVCTADYRQPEQARILSVCDQVIPVVLAKQDKRSALEELFRFLTHIPVVCKGFLGVFLRRKPK